MTNLSHGRIAEDTAEEYLRSKGLDIIARNWRTRLCEIDIVARSGKVLYFVEVKYRKGLSQGSGLEYVTPRKQQQMEFAARLWVQEHEWDGDYRLSAVEITGSDYSVTAFLPEL